MNSDKAAQRAAEKIKPTCDYIGSRSCRFDAEGAAKIISTEYAGHMKALEEARNALQLDQGMLCKCRFMSSGSCIRCEAISTINKILEG